MVVTAATETTSEAQGCLRPMDPARDLGAIADLIEDAFSREIDDRGRAAIREMRWMARLSPLVWWWSQTDPSFQDTFNGFVWEKSLPGKHAKQIVGNVSLNRTPGSYQHRIICNVVVHKAHRGQGLGRRLTERAVAEARAKGAEGVVLQVHEDNPRALRLYTDLGFQEVVGEIDLWLEAIQPVDLVPAPGYRLRPWHPSDGQTVYELARLVTPSPQYWIRPVRAEHFRLSGWARLKQTLTDLGNGQRTYRLVALEEDRLVAMMTVTVALRRGDHRLELLVHPDHQGQVERSLVSRALSMLSSMPARSVWTTVSKAHQATLEALREYGFEEQRTLLTLKRDFGRRG